MDFKAEKHFRCYGLYFTKKAMQALKKLRGWAVTKGEKASSQEQQILGVNLATLLLLLLLLLRGRRQRTRGGAGGGGRR